MAEAIFEVVADSYQDRKVKYSVGEILTVVMCSVSIGNRSIRGICELTRLKEGQLYEIIELELSNGLLSYDTVRRVLGILDSK